MSKKITQDLFGNEMCKEYSHLHRLTGVGSGSLGATQDYYCPTTGKSWTVVILMPEQYAGLTGYTPKKGGTK